MPTREDLEKNIGKSCTYKGGTDLYVIMTVNECEETLELYYAIRRINKCIGAETKDVEIVNV